MTRIIAGEARGRRLVAPKGETTRPTSDRAKEAIFSSWSTRFGLEGTRVLDLFAGSGALGLEAASRGARSVVLVENDPNAIAAIEKNIRTVGHPDVAVSPMKVSSYLAGAPGAVVTVERHRDDDETQWPEGYEQLQQKLKRRIHGMARFDTAIYNA